MKIFCVIPAYNEEKNIEKTLADLSGKVDEIIVIDDCSCDKTFELAQKSGAKTLKHLINRGQGAALQTGNEYARLSGADIVVHFDADGQFLASEIKDIVAPLREGEADIVFGSRFLGKKSKIPFLKEKIIIPIAHIVNKILIGRTLSDPQSGFRALRANVIDKIKIENDGSAHCSEIIQKSFEAGIKIKEIPTTVIYNEFGQKMLSGKGRGTGGIKIIKDLIISKLIK